MIRIGLLKLAKSVNYDKNARRDKGNVCNRMLKVNVETVDGQQNFDECGNLLLRLWTRVGSGENASFVRFEIRHEHYQT